MKTAFLSVALLIGSSVMLPAQVGQDLKNAGSDVKDAATTGAKKTKNGTTKAAKVTGRGVKKGANKAASETEKGAGKVKDKTTTATDTK
ncbi:MAG: hypothetical protein JWP08_1275 [Bryobacterales bacterium]|jgi:hypothetical protein|nr:hypothetical protein [Bryobacterales bacterium]